MKVDIPIKRVLQVRTIDWIRFLLPEAKEVELIELNPELIPKIKSQIDKLILIDKKTYCILNPMGIRIRRFR